MLEAAFWVGGFLVIAIWLNNAKPSVLSVALVIALIYGLYVLVKKVRDDAALAEREAKEEEAAAEAERIRAQDQMKRDAQDMEYLCVESIDTFQKLPGFLLRAEEHLDQAGVDLEENVPSPFWDSIEGTIEQLSAFEGGVRKIGANSQKYFSLKRGVDLEVARFPIDRSAIKGIQAAKLTEERMQNLVRLAHKVKDFPLVYEHRKTNKILVAGFSNLSVALNDLGNKIVIAVNELESTLASKLDDVHSAILDGNDSLENIASGVSSINSRIDGIQHTQKAQFDQALSMLDNIQRRRKVYPRKPLDEQY